MTMGNLIRNDQKISPHIFLHKSKYSYKKVRMLKLSGKTSIVATQVNSRWDCMKTGFKLLNAGFSDFLIAVHAFFGWKK